MLEKRCKIVERWNSFSVYVFLFLYSQSEQVCFLALSQIKGQFAVFLWSLTSCSGHFWTLTKWKSNCETLTLTLNRAAVVWKILDVKDYISQRSTEPRVRVWLWMMSGLILTGGACRTVQTAWEGFYWAATVEKFKLHRWRSVYQKDRKGLMSQLDREGQRVSQQVAERTDVILHQNTTMTQQTTTKLHQIHRRVASKTLNTTWHTHTNHLIHVAAMSGFRSAEVLLLPACLQSTETLDCRPLFGSGLNVCWTLRARVSELV